MSSSNEVILKKVNIKRNKRKKPIGDLANSASNNIESVNSISNCTKLNNDNDNERRCKQAKVDFGGREFKCVICQQQFMEHSELITHFRMHGSSIDLKGQPIYQTATLKNPKSNLIKCEWCPAELANTSKAIEHKFRMHRYNSTNYFCKLCGKLFPLKCLLNQHMIAEHNTVESTDCDRDNNIVTSNVAETSGSASNIKIEIDAESSFACSICNATFATQNALEFHSKGAHQMNTQPIVLIPPPSKKIRITKGEITSLYYCHLCGAEYILKYNFKKHLQDFHTEFERNTIPIEGIIVCKACDALFYNNKAYLNHNNHHTPEDLYVESEEQRQKLVTRIDQDFDIRRVPIASEKSNRKTKNLLVNRQ